MRRANPLTSTDLIERESPVEDTDDLVSNVIACCGFVVYFAPQAEVISVVIIGVAAFATMVTAVVEDLE